MRYSKRKKSEVVPVVLTGEGSDCMHDERLDRRLKRRHIGSQSFKVNSTGKGNIRKDIKALKSSPESVCIQKDGHDNDVYDEDYVRFFDGLVRGLFIDSGAHLDIKSSSFKKNNGRCSSSKCTESPTNVPKSNSCILLDDDDNDELDEYEIKFLENLDAGLYVDSDCDACVDVKYALSKEKNGVRSTDKGNVNVDLVNGFVENNIGGNGAVDGGCASLDDGDVNTRFVDADTTPVSLADSISRVRTVHTSKSDASVGDNDIHDDGHLNNGIVGEEAVYDGNNADDGSVDDGADNYEDPDHKMFLDNFRQDEKSCVLEISLTNEITITVRYDSQDGCSIEKPDTEWDCTKSKHTGTRKLLKIDSRSERMEARSDVTKERVETLRKLRDVPARERKFSVFESNMKKECVDPNSCRAGGGACKRPSPEALGPTNCKRKCKMELNMDQRTLRDVPSRQRKVSAVESNLNVETMDLISYRVNEGARKKPSPKALGLTNFKHKQKAKLTMVNQRTENQRNSRAAVLSRERKVSAVKSKMRKESVDPVSCRENVHANMDMVDDSYQFFLNSLKKDGGYEEDEQNSSDSEVIVMDTNQLFHGNDTPFVISKVRISEDEDWRDNGVSSKFREELMKILEKPYNESEYEDLWQKICHRGHVVRDLNLRCGPKRCETKAIGKSYLDHHADLEAKIQSAKSNKPEILNLMRGFFHWLTNTSHDGSGVFQPWLDSSCLEVRPKHNKMSPITLD